MLFCDPAFDIQYVLHGVCIVFTENSKRDCWIIMCFIYTSHCMKTHLIADTEGNLWNLDVDEGVVHCSSFLHLIDVINGVLQGANCRMCFLINLLFTLFVIHCMLYEHNQSQITDTSGGFLNDLLTPAERFSPWVTPLLGPMAPMVSSDCRGLTGIPVTPTTSMSALWPLCGSLPSTLHSHWVSLIFSVSHPHTDQGHIQSETTFNSSVDEITQ